MQTIDTVSLTELKHTDYDSLMKIRIRRILMICSNYDAFILEEDGQIELRIAAEYAELGLTTPPQFVWVSTSAQAKQVIENDPNIDMIISMFNSGDKDIFKFASDLKKQKRNIPFVLLTHFSKEITKRLAKEDKSGIDFTFTWHGNADLILAIVKLFEDTKNADFDITKTGVQAILLVEDSIRYYSMYLPELYKLVLKQSSEVVKDTLNEQQQKNRKKSRPKILLATNYEDAISLYDKYKANMLGVISDVGFVMHRNDPPEMEVLDAGIQLVKYVKQDEPQMPIVLQSSQGSLATVAEELGVGFLKKYSKTLIISLADFIKEELCFGDFVFRDKNKEEYGRAGNLRELERLIREVPDDILTYVTSRNMLSKWFYARGMFTLADKIKKVQRSNFESTEAIRQYLSQHIHDYHVLFGRGIIAHFNSENYGKYIWFSKTGEGSLGGKARGLAFLNGLVKKYALEKRYTDTKVSIPRTFVIATDYFDQFIVENGLHYVIESDITDEEILSEFVSSRLPEELVNDLKAYIQTVKSPLAVRSSSKLEDSNYQPFAGVYSTYMIPSVENKGQMLRMLEKAIKSVYASVFFSGSRAYIQTTGNLLSEEKMAVVIQTICGSEHDGYFYPLLSGVARSVNFYPIGNEKLEDGIINLAFGLGKTVVDGGNSLRFNPKFPKKILQLSDPKLAMRDAQKTMFVLDLRPGSFKVSKNDSINLAKISIQEGLEACSYANLVASTFSSENNRIVPGVSVPGSRIITFDSILKYGKYPVATILQDVMSICKKELMCDVEMEFAADIIQKNGEDILNFKLLQVRPISEFAEEEGVDIDVVKNESEVVLVESSKALGSGRTSDMKYLVYVSPDEFDSSRTKEFAAQISELNQKIKSEGGSYLLIGPGRWGSSDPWLGIPVAWSDISEAKMIVECAIPGFQIEPSQGTHFFQNITSLGVGYLTVDTVNKDGIVDFKAIESLECIENLGAVKCLRLPDSLISYIERNTSRAIVAY
jgi:hypothetical protein